VTLTSCSGIDERLLTSTPVPEEHATSAAAQIKVKALITEQPLVHFMANGSDAKPRIAPRCEKYCCADCHVPAIQNCFYC
jgi:nitrate reductase cytochrome c-type subunit